ncbi:MAG: hypothetical protein A2Y10_20265 [Planctomycetes bacterium GWF2_41_51]|nr:MAG: hypothetical protein A2Y10_20265 [Planctomycetes bacterium GWF2_41_51]HBG25750.1 hypothetical protein [Phycisphaerales bacterium]
MDSKKFHKYYAITEIPDPSDARYQASAEGNVHGKIQLGFEQIYRTMVNMPADSVWLRIIYLYRPVAEVGHKQNRLSIFIELSSSDKLILKNLDCMLCGGVLSRFYDLKAFDVIKYDETKYPSVCYIKRQTNLIEPLYTNELNPSIPKRYFTISPFEACADNNYLLLDQNLDKIAEPVLISLNASPADITKYLKAHTAYLAQLCLINRAWRDDDEYGFEYDGHANCGTSTKLEALSLRDPLADDIIRLQRRFHETLLEPHLGFEFKVMAANLSTSQMIASTICNCAFSDGKYRIYIPEKIEAMVHENFDILIEMEQYATVEELAGIMKLPIASVNSPLCIRKNNDPRPLDGNNIITFGHDIQGFKYEDGIVRGIIKDLLCKHLAVFGMSGGGKTTFMFKLLIQLWVLGIPFILIECAKKEYRQLKMLQDHNDPRVCGLARSLQIYTPGYDRVSPFRFNPLDYPDGVYQLAHIESIKSCIESSIPVSCGSLPSLIFEGFEEVYERYQSKEIRPVMADLISQIERVFATKNYSSDVKANMQTVIEVRLNSLARSMIGKIFQCSEGIDIGQLVKVPSICEIDILQKEHKCISTLFLLNAIREYFSIIQSSKKDGLQYVIIIEEAHNILGRSAQSVVSEDMTDPQIGAAELVSNLLLEFRNLKCGIVICNQHPSNIHEAASKSVGSKITFRQTHSDDLDELKKGMLMGDIESKDTARLKPGEAYLFTEGYYGPRKIQTDNLHDWLYLKNPPSDDQLRVVLEKESWFKIAREKRISAELIQLSAALDEFESYRKAAMKRFDEITRKFISVLDEKNGILRQNHLSEIFQRFRGLRNEIIRKFRDFKKGPWKTYCYLEKEYLHESADIAAFGSKIFNLYNNRTEPNTRSLLLCIEKNLQKLSLIYHKEISHG